MSGFKGTPGEWAVGMEGEILSDAGYIVMKTDLVHGNDNDLDLIAAAPELLEALQDVVDYHFGKTATAPAYLKAKAAIAKALGNH